MKVKKLSKVEKQFTKAVVLEKLAPSDACRQIFAEKNLTPQSAHVKAIELFGKPNVRKEIWKLCDEYGLSREHLVLKLAHIVNNGKKESTQLKAIETSFRLHGELVKGGDQTKKDVKILNLFIKNSRERGIELPVDIKKAMSEIIEQNKEEELITPAEVESE